jgi:ABC-2 type transport system ATP-binding protein
MTSTPLAIETSELSKTYGAVHAVRRLSLRVHPGEVFGFLGPNGAGKTTTIRMLLALQRPSSGRAAVLGLDAGRDSVSIHRRVGYLPGELALYPHRTGRQLVDWFGEVRGGVDAATIADLVERFAVVMDRPVRDLSKGNRQKLGLVLAFMHRPELLILDEPTSGLDPLMQSEFERLVRETAAQGRTVFLSSHELGEVQRLADRVAIIRSGELVAADSVEGLRRQAPQRVEARFDAPVDASTFARLEGVTVVSCAGPRVALQVAGRIGPVLGVIASLDPVDVTSQHADLDELFLSFYTSEAPDVR